MCPVWESTNRKWGCNLKHDITPSREPAPLLYFSRSKTDIYISKLKLFAKIRIKSIPLNTLSKTLSTIFLENKYIGFVLTFVWFWGSCSSSTALSAHGWWNAPSLSAENHPRAGQFQDITSGRELSSGAAQGRKEKKSLLAIQANQLVSTKVQFRGAPHTNLRIWYLIIIVYYSEFCFHCQHGVNFNVGLLTSVSRGQLGVRCVPLVWDTILTLFIYLTTKSKDT